jgi:hypothetical protein
VIEETEEKVVATGMKDMTAEMTEGVVETEGMTEEAVVEIEETEEIN